MKMFHSMSLQTLRDKLAEASVNMTDAEFQSYTYSELKKLYRLAKRAIAVCAKVDAIMDKHQAPAELDPVPGEWK